MNKIFDNLEREKKLQSVSDNWMDSLLHVKPNKCHFLKFKFEIQNGLCPRLISDFFFCFSGRFSAILIHLIDGLNLVLLIDSDGDPILPLALFISRGLVYRLTKSSKDQTTTADKQLLIKSTFYRYDL